MEEGYIHYNFVFKLIMGVGHVQFYSTDFASEFFSLSSIQGLKMSPLCSRLLGLFSSATCLSKKCVIFKVLFHLFFARFNNIFKGFN